MFWFLRDLSIKRKVMAIMLIICSVILFFTFIIYFINEAITFSQKEKERLSALATVLGSNAAASLMFNDAKAAQETLFSLQKEDHVISAFIFTGEANLFAVYGSASAHHREYEAKELRQLVAEAEESTVVNLDGDIEVMEPILVEGQPVGKILIRADLHDLYETLGRILKLIAVVSLAAIAFGLFLLSRLQRIISDPILELAQAMTAVSESRDYSIRVEKKGKDEVGTLIDGFNLMLAEIQLRESQLQEANGRLQKELLAKEQTEAALQASYTFSKTVLDSIHDPICIIDVQTFAIVGANATYLRLVGKTMDEVHGQPCYQLVHGLKAPCSGENRECPMIKMLETGEFTLCEQIKYGVGDKRYMEVSSAPIRDASGKIVQAVHASRDITFRRAAEEETKLLNRKLTASNRDLVEINEEIKNFAYIVSHDLRAPLVSIKGFSSELQYAMKDIFHIVDQAAAHLPEKERKNLDQLLQGDVKESLDFIHSSVTRMDGLINSILNLSRMGRREIKPELLDLNLVVKQIIDSLAHQIENNHVKVHVGQLPTLMADKLSMEQVLGNLIDNALKYLDPARNGEIEITADVGDGETRIHVRDNGRGIAQEDMHKIFELFGRAGKQDVQGEGMGLAYVKTLLRHHGGRIICQSDLNAGTTFIVTLPTTGEEL